MAGRMILIVALTAALASVTIAAQHLWSFARGISDPGSLPAQVYACDRTWVLSEGTPWTAERARSEDGKLYSVVPGPFGLFTSCRLTAQGYVPTLLFVRTGEDAYAVYSLQGGP